MCNFFSLVSDPVAQKIMYSDWRIRTMILSGELDMEPDSHTAIAKYHGYNAKQEDKLNKYEYNPLTKKFVIDQINNEIDDSSQIEKFCTEMNFSKIVPALVVKPIIHPFEIKPPQKITKKHLSLLKDWDSVWDSVRASVGDSVWDSVGDSVGASVRDSVRDSVRASVRASGWDSVWDSVWAYIGSFFIIEQWQGHTKKGTYPYDCLVKLWEMGLVPSFDGKTWRLHGGENGKILWEGKL